MTHTKTLPIETLRELLSYDPDNGTLTWRVNRTGGIKAGDSAGCAVANGRVVVKVLGSIYKRARLAWALHTGKWPEAQIDHWDTDPSNDRFSNLRDVPHGMNQQNQRRAQRSNPAGLLGARSVNGRFQSQLKVGKRSIYLGTFDTAEAAHEAYKQAKRVHHPGCTI